VEVLFPVINKMALK